MYAGIFDISWMDSKFISNLRFGWQSVANGTIEYGWTGLDWFHFGHWRSIWHCDCWLDLRLRWSQKFVACTCNSTNRKFSCFFSISFYRIWHGSLWVSHACLFVFFLNIIQISFLLIIYAQNVYYLYVSRVLTGFVGGGLFVVIPLMVAEIAEDR